MHMVAQPCAMDSPKWLETNSIWTFMSLNSLNFNTLNFERKQFSSLISRVGLDAVIFSLSSIVTLTTSSELIASFDFIYTQEMGFFFQKTQKSTPSLTDGSVIKLDTYVMNSRYFSGNLILLSATSLSLPSSWLASIVLLLFFCCPLFQVKRDK